MYLTPGYRAAVGAVGVLLGGIALYAFFLWIEDVMFSENKHRAAFHNLLFKRPRTLAAVFVIGLVLNGILHWFIYMTMVVNGNVFDPEELSKAEVFITMFVNMAVWIGWMIYGIAIVFEWVVRAISHGHTTFVNIGEYWIIAGALLLVSKWVLPKMIMVEIGAISLLFGVRA